MTSLSSRVNQLPVELSKQRLRVVPASLAGIHTGDEDGYGAPDPGRSHAENEVEERSFEVEVVNGSDRFSSFQIELSVPGQEVNAANRWYEVEPEVCSKCPPGDRTQFRVVIHRAPIPAVNTTLDLNVHIFSVEYEELETVAHLDLKIEQRSKPLQIHLVSKHLKAMPGERVTISALALNFQSDPAAVTIKLLQLDSSWVSGTALVQGDEVPRIEQTLPGGDSQPITFYCVPPKAPLTESRMYEFCVEISDAGQHQRTYTAPGMIEVLPVGTVHFHCTPKRQVIPGPVQKWVKQGVHQTAFQLEFENHSNLGQQVQIEAVETHNYPCQIKPIPPIKLDANETAHPFPLQLRRQRPLVGWERRLLIEVSPTLTYPESGEAIDHIQVKPSTQIVDVRVRPIVPLWLQIVALFLSVGLLGWLWWLRPVIKHKAPVTAVHIIGNTSEVISGSRDQTLRRWSVMPFANWFTGERRLWYRGQLTPTETSDRHLGQAVRTIEEIPKRENQVAVGLEDGSIQLWGINPGEWIASISTATDRVFALSFSDDGRFLFSGHGSGIVRQWDLRSPTIRQFPDAPEMPKIEQVIGVSIRDLATIEHPRRSMVAIASQENQLVLWDWVGHQTYHVPYRLNPEVPLNIAPVSTTFNALTSIAVSDNHDLMATADDRGFITLWNVNEIMDCSQNELSSQLAPTQLPLNNAQPETLDVSAPKERPKELPFIPLTQCDADLQFSQWQATGGGRAIRAIALTDNGQHLVSVADTGTITLWPLEQLGNGHYQRRQDQDGDALRIPIDRVADYIPQAIDMRRDGPTHVMIAVDAPGDRVRLYRRHIKTEGL